MNSVLECNGWTDFIINLYMDKLHLADTNILLFDSKTKTREVTPTPLDILILNHNISSLKFVVRSVRTLKSIRSLLWTPPDVMGWPFHPDYFDPRIIIINFMTVKIFVQQRQNECFSIPIALQGINYPWCDGICIKCHITPKPVNRWWQNSMKLL